MKSPGGLLFTGFIALVTLATAAPLLIQLSQVLIPLVIAVGVMAVVLRLVFFHTRRW
jgi:hypothetical protein